MRQTKRMAGLLIVTALLMLTTLNAFAASGGYVPTTAQVYEYKKGKWVKSYTLKRTYTKDGKLKKQTSTASFSLGDDKYTWKGNYITKASVFTPGKGTIETYTYSKGFRTKYVMDSAAGITTFKYNWTGKKAKVTKAGPGYASSQSVKVNSKKQVISKERT